MIKIGFSFMLYTQGDGLAAWATGLPLLQSSEILAMKPQYVSADSNEINQVLLCRKRHL